MYLLAVLRPFLDAMPALADSGYEGAGHDVHVPVKKPAGMKELDISNRTRNALLSSARCLGERGFALLAQRWQTLQTVTASPGKSASSPAPPLSWSYAVTVRRDARSATRPLSRRPWPGSGTPLT
jgi:hypothetical protein